MVQLQDDVIHTVGCYSDLAASRTASVMSKLPLTKAFLKRLQVTTIADRRSSLFSRTRFSWCTNSFIKTGCHARRIFCKQNHFLNVAKEEFIKQHMGRVKLTRVPPTCQMATHHFVMAVKKLAVLQSRGLWHSPVCRGRCRATGMGRNTNAIRLPQANKHSIRNVVFFGPLKSPGFV